MVEEDISFDIESNNLLNEESIDYCASPFKLKEDFAVHCIVVEEHSTGDIIAFYDGPTYELDGRRYEEEVEGHVYVLEDYVPVKYKHLQLNQFKHYVETKKIRRVIGHNIINFDLLCCKLYFGMDYEVSPDLWCGKEVTFEDTFVKSKTLNPDRFDGHSLDALSAKTNIRKIEFRPNMKDDVKFKHFAADMLYYNIYDVKANTAVDRYLEKEREGWNWDGPLELEKAVAEIITRQAHRGFWFDTELAQRNVEELDALMKERIEKIEPLLPSRPATKKFLSEHTPPAVQRTKKGEGPISAVMVKWVDKHGGKVLSDTQVEVFGKVYDLPIERVPLITHMKATINDVTHIKGWLVGMGWTPTEYKERDLGVDTKKQKLSVDKFQDAVKRYVDQTLSSPFKADRLEHLKTTEAKLLNHLLGKQGKMCKVLTNPSLTVGQDKNICPNLEALSEKFPYAQDIIEYFTYRHRRNSILGGGAVWDEGDDDQEFEKGYVANVRKDGRIPTPADTCGAATSRFKHRVVCNIPRVSSLYGGKMRALFGVDKGFYQIGYDFDSLEARMESHYCSKYDPSKEYCNSLLLEKPNDVHSRTAKKVSEIIGREFARQTAKNVKYGCLPTDNTEVLGKDGWTTYSNLKEGQEILSFNRDLDIYEWTPITKLWYYPGADVVKLSNRWFSMEATEDHYWFGKRRTGKGGTRRVVDCRFMTQEITSEHNILHASYIEQKTDWTPEECKLIGWLLSDGYYRWSGSKRNKEMGITVSIDQDDKKYIKELKEVLDSQTTYKEYRSGSMSKLVPDRNYVRALLKKAGFTQGEGKHESNWSSWVLKQDSKNLKAFLEAFILGDGWKVGGSFIIRQNEGNIAEAIRLAANLCGYRVTWHNSDGCCNINLSELRYTTGQRIKIEPSRKTDVFCVSTKNESFVIRQNSTITLTGNCTYGAQAAKVAKTIGADLETGEIVFNAFWAAASPLKALKDRLSAFWEKTGKKFILGIDGRKVPTRSAHAILNSLFQSAGVLCAKRAMVIHDRKMKAEGYTVDFFKDDWKNMKFCQQVVAYHDESQLEVSKELVKFKMFKTEVEAATWKKEQEARTGEIWSDVSHTDKGYYLAYCRAGELASEAVKESGKYYNLNVELTAGYIIGRNWKETH